MPETYTADILVVDDNPHNLQLLQAMLTSQGYKVRPALNGQVALAAALSATPDLIMLDILMPEMDGYEVCVALKSHQTLVEVPVIFLSALTDEVDQERAYAVGGSDYIRKPFHVADVLAKVKEHLG